MAAMQTVSARIPSEDLQWLATLDVQGATTPSDKLRALVAQLRRQHEGALEYGASLQWMRDLVAPFVTAVGAFEHRYGKHSEIVRLMSDRVPQLMAILVAENSLGREPQRKAQEIEDQRVQAGVDSQGERAILAVSRSILYASNGDDYADAAKEEARILRDRMNAARAIRTQL